MRGGDVRQHTRGQFACQYHRFRGGVFFVHMANNSQAIISQDIKPLVPSCRRLRRQVSVSGGGPCGVLQAPLLVCRPSPEIKMAWPGMQFSPGGRLTQESLVSYEDALIAQTLGCIDGLQMKGEHPAGGFDCTQRARPLCVAGRWPTRAAWGTWQGIGNLRFNCDRRGHSATTPRPSWPRTSPH